MDNLRYKLRRSFSGRILPSSPSRGDLNSRIDENGDDIDTASSSITHRKHSSGGGKRSRWARLKAKLPSVVKLDEANRKYSSPHTEEHPLVNDTQNFQYVSMVDVLKEVEDDVHSLVVVGIGVSWNVSSLLSLRHLASLRKVSGCVVGNGGGGGDDSSVTLRFFFVNAEHCRDLCRGNMVVVGGVATMMWFKGRPIMFDRDEWPQRPLFVANFIGDDGWRRIIEAVVEKTNTIASALPPRGKSIEVNV